MKKALAVVLLMLLAAGISTAQDKSGGETKIVIQQQQEVRQDYYTVRVGAWFPKDKEQGVKLDDIAFNKADGAIDEAQALGFDFHFRKNIGSPFYSDLSVGGWYTSYQFNPNADYVGVLEQYDAWTVIVPVTIGLSVAPLPDNPIQPYAGAGIGLYVAFTGHDDLQVSEENEVPDDTESYIRFGYYVHAGLDFMLSGSFGISVGAKYQFIEFDKDKPLFTGHTNFTGLQALVGVAMMI